MMKKREGNNLFCSVIFLFLIILFCSITSAELKSKISKDPEYLKVLTEFNKTDRVSVIIGVASDDVREEVISSLSGTEITSISRSLLGKSFSGEITRQGLDKLINNSNIKWINLQAILTTGLSQSIPLINATQVWTKGYTGKGQTVCVIDTGVNATIPALQGKVIAEKCYCSLHEGANSACCPNGANEDNSAIDNSGHGTHVTGIIVSQDSTYKGVAPNASVVMVKVCNSSASCNGNDIANGITWCKNNKNTYNISVITISLYDYGNYAPGGCTPQWADEEINAAVGEEIFLDAISGNEGYKTGISYPACSPNATSVGASTKSDLMASYTNRASNLDLLAPGSGIWSLRWNSNSCLSGCSCSGNFMECSGTSMAAPHVAGVAVLLKERDPSLNPSQIKNALKNTTYYIYDYPYTNISFPRLDALDAFNSLCTCTNWTAGSCGGTGQSCSKGDRHYTRTCNPSACNIESKCDYDSSCGGGAGQDITVCVSGCNYTTIKSAVDYSKTSDRIFINDARTYNENVILNSTTSPWLDCKGGAKIHSQSGSGNGIYARGVDGPVIVNCYLDHFSNGIYLANSSYGTIENNTLEYNGVGILLKEYSYANKIKGNQVKNNNANGIKLDGFGWSSSIVSYNTLENNILTSNTYEGVYAYYGLYNQITDNNLSSHSDFGIHIYTHDWYSGSTIQSNRLYNNGEGIFFEYSNYNKINTNGFCPSNTNVDIDLGSSTNTNGNNNTCEKPGSWNDDGKTGCSFSCYNPPTVTLLYPPNNYISTESNIDFVCQATDDNNLKNITLYHNISGTWQANQTKSISGVSNITTFTINNIQEGVSFKWNCLAYNDKSKGSFASDNWTVNVNLVIPNDTHKFYIKNLSGDSVAWLGDLGNIVLKGNCTSQPVCNAPADSFIIANSTNDTLAYIDRQGNMCIEKGDCSDESAFCNPPREAFVIQNSSASNMSYIDFDGDLCLIGGLYENSNP